MMFETGPDSVLAKRNAATLLADSGKLTDHHEMRKGQVSGRLRNCPSRIARTARRDCSGAWSPYP